MKHLIKAFLKIFFRNRRTIFFVILLPAAIFLVMALLGLGQVIRFDLPVSYTDFLLPGIAAFAVMQMGIYTVAYNLIDYKKTSILKRLSVTPLTGTQFLTAQVLTRFLIAILQTAVLLILGIAIFHTQIRVQWVLLPFIIFLGNWVFINFGFLIASIAGDYEEAAPYATIIGMSLTFLGDVFFPTRNLPPALQSFSSFLPLKPFSEILRYAVLATKPENLYFDFLILLVWLLVLGFMAKIVFEKKAYK